MNTLRIEGLSKVYANGTKALDGINLTINDGLFGLLGPNGAGKSTLMRTIAALQEPTSGQLFFNYIDIIAQPQSIRNQLGFLPQEFGVYPKISAYELLNHIAILKGIMNAQDRKEQVNALLAQTNLYEVRKKAVSSFSGGMKQRFGIAQALLGNPKLIIVDEPTAGLDPSERNRFHNLLCEIGENIIVILSTHIVEDVRELCKKMAILHSGKLLFEGIPTDVIAELKGKVWCKTGTKKELQTYNEAFNVLSTRMHEGNILIHVLSDSQPTEGFQPINPDLEDVYFSLINQPLITQ